MTNIRVDDLENYRITPLPDAGFYIPSFMSPEVELSLLELIQSYSRPWTVLSNRRLLSLPSQLSGAARDTLIDGSSLPSFLIKPIVDRFLSHSIFGDSPHGAPNHCLVNEYTPGQGIMPHEDGPAYYPVTATVSLGGHTVLDIYRKKDNGERENEPYWRILQEPRSLLLTTGNMYSETMHGIAELEVDENLNQESIVNWSLLEEVAPFESGIAKRETRISLTYRDVKKVAKVGGAIKFLGKR